MITFDIAVKLPVKQSFRQDSILEHLDRRDRRLFSGSEVDIFGQNLFISFTTHREDIAARLERNLRKAVKRARIRAAVQSWAIIS